MRKNIVFILRSVLAFACAHVLCSAVARADEIQNPEPKVNLQRHFNRKLFFAETAALGASAAFDWTTTAQCQQRGCQESASSWAIGHFPSNSKIVRYGAAWAAADTASLFFAERSRHKWFRWLGRAYLAYEIQDHTLLALHNRRLCHPLGQCGGQL